MEIHHEGGEEVAREPDFDDVTRLCSELNRKGVRYVLVGGFAIVLQGFPRLTADIDLLIETTVENERATLEALLFLPNQRAREIRPGDVAEYGVVRIGDDITVDLMKSGCNVTYADAIRDAEIREVRGVPIPIASLSTLWRMKQTYREKDIPDRRFLRERMEAEGIPLDPPPVDAAPPDPYGHLAVWVQRVLRFLERWFPRR